MLIRCMLGLPACEERSGLDCENVNRAYMVLVLLGRVANVRAANGGHR